MDWGAWWATVHGVAQNWTGLNQLSNPHTERETYKADRNWGSCYRPWSISVNSAITPSQEFPPPGLHQYLPGGSEQPHPYPQAPQHRHWSPCLKPCSLSIHLGTNGLPESGTSPPLLMKSQILHLPSLNSAPSLTSSTGLSHTRWRPRLGTWNSLPPSLSLWKQLPALSNIAQESFPSRGLLRTPPPPGAP